MTTKKRRTPARHSKLAHRTMLVLAGCAVALGGCALAPQGPTPISRLPASQSGVPAGAHPLTPEERARYDAIDRQVLAEQDLAMAREAEADAWARAYTPPVTLYGGYFGGWRGPGWSVGFGNAGWGPGWGPGWGRWGWGGGGMGWGMGWGW